VRVLVGQNFLGFLLEKWNQNYLTSSQNVSYDFDVVVTKIPQLGLKIRNLRVFSSCLVLKKSWSWKKRRLVAEEGTSSKRRPFFDLVCSVFFLLGTGELLLWARFKSSLLGFFWLVPEERRLVAEEGTYSKKTWLPKKEDFSPLGW
jgi:hypothetical protein